MIAIENVICCVLERMHCLLRFNCNFTSLRAVYGHSSYYLIINVLLCFRTTDISIRIAQDIEYFTIYLMSLSRSFYLENKLWFQSLPCYLIEHFRYNKVCCLFAIKSLFHAHYILISDHGFKLTLIYSFSSSSSSLVVNRNYNCTSRSAQIAFPRMGK